MPSIENYKKYVLNNEKYVGRVHKYESDMVIDKTWDNEVGSVKAFIYDYYHDDQVETPIGYDPTESKTKTPIDAKFHTSGYNSLSKDTPAFLLQFRPYQDNPLDYYNQSMGKYWGEFPVGCYIDLPNDRGEYRKWIICDKSNTIQFVNYEILPCNYYFHWIDVVDGQPIKRKVWGVARMRNSYNSGIWTDYKFTTIENQDQIWLPMTDITARLTYNHRIIVSAPIEEPTTWQVSKAENFHPLGITKVTIYQTKFDPKNDYVNLETGEMFADYNTLGITPIDDNITTGEYLEISFSGKTQEIVKNREKTLYAHLINGDTTTDIVPTWTFIYDGTETIGNEDIQIINNGATVTVKALTDNAINKDLIANIDYEDKSASLELHIKAL